MGETIFVEEEQNVADWVDLVLSPLAAPSGAKGIKNKWSAHAHVLCGRNSSNGTNDLVPNSSLKGILIQDTSKMWPTFDIRRNLLFSQSRWRNDRRAWAHQIIYYKILQISIWGPEDGAFTLEETRFDDITKVSIEENTFLTAPFTENEVGKAILDMKRNKAHGIDGFSAEFYQNFWEVIKLDPMEKIDTRCSIRGFNSIRWSGRHIVRLVGDM